MDRIKCHHCGLVNATSASTCRRCGMDPAGRYTPQMSPTGPREAAKSSSWLYTLLFIALIGGAAYYLLSGVEKSYDHVKANEANRIATQPKQPAGLTNRTEVDQKRAGQYKNAIQNSHGLAESQNAYEETQKLMQPAARQNAKIDRVPQIRHEFINRKLS